MSLALHRKYRPQTFKELDQKKVREFFLNVLKTGQFAQSYLLTGQKGTGKTSAARILAKVVNCEKNSQLDQDLSSVSKLAEPCNECVSCKSITKGSSAAVVEMDAASNRGIDDIRQLRDQIYTVPADVRFAVYIIDEVHMLTKEAFNALLKTLEEPPKHAIFCLATTEFHKLPATIVSRCTVVRYQRASDEEIKAALTRVVKGEKLSIDNQVLQRIAEKSDGSFRDGVNILQSAIGKDKKIDLEKIEALIGSSGRVLVEELYGYLLKGDVKSALELLKKAYLRGDDLEYLSKSILEYGMEQIDQLIEQEHSVDADALLLIEVFSQTFKRYSEVPIPILPLEMAVVEYCVKKGSISSSSSSNPPTKTTSKSGSTTESSQTKSKSETTKAVHKATPVASAPVSKSQNQVEEPKPVSEKTKVAPSPPVDKDLPSVPTDKTVNLVIDDVKKNWQKMLDQIGQKNHAIVTLLRRGVVSTCKDNRIILKVKYEFHKQQLEQNRYASVIEGVFFETFGGYVKLDIQLDESVIVKQTSPHNNVTGSIPSQDEGLVSAVEDAFGI